MLQCGTQWGTFPAVVRTGVAGLLPLRHLGSTPTFDPDLDPLAFRGAFDYTLDAKNRLTVPAKFRNALSQGLVLAKGVEPCVAIWRPEDYDAFLAGALGGVNPLSPQRRQVERYFSANSFPERLDSAGRVGPVPSKLMDHAKLSKDVVVVGAGSCVEVWDRERWHAYDAELTAEIPDLTASLGHPA